MRGKRRAGKRRAVIARLVGVTAFGLMAAAATEVAAADLPAGMTAWLDAAAEHDAEVVRFAENGADGPALVLATRVAVDPARLIAALADPVTYQRAVPAFVRAEVLSSAASAPSPAVGQARLPLARLIAWELEVPLWNFAGQLWLRPQPTGVVLELVAGDLAPGRLQIDVLPPARSGGRATLALSGTVAIEKANFVTRRLAARDPLAATAMRATALYVLLRALALEAVRTGALPSPRRRPRAPIVPPAQPEGAPAFLTGVAGTATGEATAKLPPAGVPPAWAVVSSRRDGRLDRVSIALPLAMTADHVVPLLASPSPWRLLPGWRDTEAKGSSTPPLWEVDSGLPFVDFDAIWSILSVRPFRAQARAGDWRGPTIAVDVVVPGPAPPSSGPHSVMVYTTTPLIDRTGYLPRRLIEAEPLLEQGLALGLAFVNARSLARGLASPPPR